MLLGLHMPDHVLNGPVTVFTNVAAITAIVWSLWRLRAWDCRDLGSAVSTVADMAAIAAAILAVQSLNVPLGLWGVSGHLFCCVLASVWLGPWKGLLVMAAVVSVQAFVLNDGGKAAWGANVLNMAVLGSAGGYGLMRGLEHVPGLGRRTVWQLGRYFGEIRAVPMIAASLAAGLSVPLMALSAGVQMAVSGTAPLPATLEPLLGMHALIGLGEAVATYYVLHLVLTVDPFVIHFVFLPDAPRARQLVTTLGIAVVFAVLAGTVSSTAPDALEHVVNQVAPPRG